MSDTFTWPRRARRAGIAFVPALLFAGVRVVFAQQTAAASYTRDVPAALASQAKISEDSARVLAGGQVPGGALKALELEREEGKLVYSMEYTIPSRRGVEEVNIDALSGAVVGKEHESASRERAEAAARP